MKTFHVPPEALKPVQRRVLLKGARGEQPRVCVVSARTRTILYPPTTRSSAVRGYREDQPLVPRVAIRTSEKTPGTLSQALRKRAGAQKPIRRYSLPGELVEGNPGHVEIFARSEKPSDCVADLHRSWARHAPCSAARTEHRTDVFHVGVKSSALEVQRGTTVTHLGSAFWARFLS